MKRLVLVSLITVMLVIGGCATAAPATETTASPAVQTATPVTTTQPAPATTLTTEPNVPEPADAPDADANELYPPSVTIALLTGQTAAPEGFDEMITAAIGAARLQELRSGGSFPSGTENDLAADCLLELGVPPETFSDIVNTAPDAGNPQPGGDTFDDRVPTVSVTEVDSSYRTASGGLSGWFTSGQASDMMLSGIDFNQTGGGLLFNHPKSIATDGTHLLLADGNNNRVLIWNSLPTGNTAPDIVLGQPDMDSNNPGTGLGEMDWPGAVTTDGTRVLVADTYNNRILIWNEFPTQNGQPADIILGGNAESAPIDGEPDKSDTGWPWGIWTDGQKLAVSCTAGGYVLIWNEFPTRDRQPADIYLTGGGDLGTPRTITSDGDHLIVGDHNAHNTSNDIGNFFWNSFPTVDDEPYDYFTPDPTDANYAWMQGSFTDDGRLVMLGRTLHIWNSYPESADDTPDISITGHAFEGGDGGDVAIAGDLIYVCEYNGNRITVYNEFPTSPTDVPDFAIGSPDIATNTLDTNYFITNAMPATNGESLFVSSDFDRKLYVWNQIPDESGAYPDLVYDLPEAPWDNALWENTLALAGKGTVYIWEELPLDGQVPSRTFTDSIGGIRFDQLTGVALDHTYFYLSDFAANRVYIWEGIPESDEAPVFSIDINGPWRLSSDGEYLAVTAIYDHAIYVYRVDELAAGAQPVTVGEPGTYNLPQYAIVAHGSLFVSDTNFNKVHVWQDTEDAVNGRAADVVLGKDTPNGSPMIGTDTIFWPAGLAFDGNYLWVGEFKFSCRLLRFSVH